MSPLKRKIYQKESKGKLEKITLSIFAVIGLFNLNKFNKKNNIIKFIYYLKIIPIN